MFGVFKVKPLLDSGDMEFMVATYRWLLKNFGGSDFYEETSLVLPTKDFFPAVVGSEEEAAYQTFLAVKKYAGMEDWKCNLECQEEDVDALLAPAILVQEAPRGPHGTFGVEGSGEITITYNPSTVRNPPQLVATFAHELSHYLTGCSFEDPPGGWENWEFATDIAATFLGFGVFMANTAFNFHQFSSTDSMGWGYSRSGYLSEFEHIYALAIFLRVKKLDEGQVFKHLKKSLVKPLKRALVELESNGIVDELAAVEYAPQLT